MSNKNINQNKLVQFPTTIEKVGVILSLLALALAFFLPQTEGQSYKLIPMIFGGFAFVSVTLMALQLKNVHEGLRSRHLTLMALIDSIAIVAVLISLNVFQQSV